MLLFFIFINLIEASDNICDKRTSYYHDTFVSNNNYYYYVPMTYFESDNSMTVQNYKELIKSISLCTGKWCVNNKWGCAVGDSKNCYNVEHIIPTANNIPQIKGCSLDIRGNYIMSYGAWNQALGNDYYGEKSLIYGDERMKSAYKSVYLACYKKEPTEYPNDLCLSGLPSKYIYIILISIFMCALLIIGIIIFYHKFCQKSKIKLHDNENKEEKQKMSDHFLEYV